MRIRKITQQAVRAGVPGIRKLTDDRLIYQINQTWTARRGTHEWYLWELSQRELLRRNRPFFNRIQEFEREKFVRVYDWELKSDRLTIQTTGTRDFAEHMAKAMEAGNLGPFTIRKVGA